MHLYTADWSCRRAHNTQYLCHLVKCDSCRTHFEPGPQHFARYPRRPDSESLLLDAATLLAVALAQGESGHQQPDNEHPIRVKTGTDHGKCNLFEAPIGQG